MICAFKALCDLCIYGIAPLVHLTRVSLVQCAICAFQALRPLCISSIVSLLNWRTMGFCVFGVGTLPLDRVRDRVR